MENRRNKGNYDIKLNNLNHKINRKAAILQDAAASRIGIELK